MKKDKTKISGENRHMDIFDVLKAISKRKIEIIHDGTNDKDALTKAEIDISEEYHIPLLDIRRLYRADSICSNKS